MTILELRFPAGRYHATPWGRHVNEGAIEWPPSPWRILRALVATWHLKTPEVPAEAVRSLIHALSAPPAYQLPLASASHTRHYMPFNEGRNEKTTKVFDTFLQLQQNAPILVGWNLDLDEENRVVLERLASRLGYFGRAESLVFARILNTSDFTANSSPHADGARVPENHELVRLLAPLSPTEYDGWRRDFMDKTLAALGPKPTAAQRKKLPHVPPDLFTALHADSGDLLNAGWNLPPGAQFVNYTRPVNAIVTAPRPRRRHASQRPTMARYALTSVVPPSITRALAVGEQVHTVLCKESDGHPVFTGAEADGHRHAHVFSESIDDPWGHITHITVYAHEGFDEKAIRALRALQWTWGFNKHELRLVLHGIGDPADFADCALFVRSASWRSLTPFVSTRHAKTFRDGRPKIDDSGWQIGSAPHDLLRLVRDHTGRADVQVRCLNERLPFRFGERAFRSLQFLTQRQNGKGRRGNGTGNAFELTFSEPISGPLAFGYGSHFGLGLFHQSRLTVAPDK